uniref:Uncharacterized protein n=1 Tax=Pyxicephalus adspersus TaxID=30357 RepID=A0AAV3A0J7_PYXAD|nr:TPA: hypothetical protein GDO54_003141 [Pyxicephalus adspersus]
MCQCPSSQLAGMNTVTWVGVMTSFTTVCYTITYHAAGSEHRHGHQETLQPSLNLAGHHSSESPDLWRGVNVTHSSTWPQTTASEHPAAEPCCTISNVRCCSHKTRKS